MLRTSKLIWAPSSNAATARRTIAYCQQGDLQFISQRQLLRAHLHDLKRGMRVDY